MAVLQKLYTLACKVGITPVVGIWSVLKHRILIFDADIYDSKLDQIPPKYTGNPQTSTSSTKVPLISDNDKIVLANIHALSFEECKEIVASSWKIVF
jgi:hypothetical protein